MKLQNLYFPAGLILLVAMLTPILFGQASTVTYVLEGLCAASFLFLIGVAVYNNYQDYKTRA